MKIILTEWCRDWQAATPQQTTAVEMDLTYAPSLQYLVLSLGMGNFDEVRIETDTVETLDFVRRLLTGTGGAVQTAADGAAVDCKLYKPGYHVYRQDDLAIFFLNTTPCPDAFSNVPV